MSDEVIFGEFQAWEAEDLPTARSPLSLPRRTRLIRVEAVTVRADHEAKPIFGPGGGVYLAQAAVGAAHTLEWKDRILAAGHDHRGRGANSPRMSGMSAEVEPGT